jgi:hypothetical protein
MSGFLNLYDGFFTPSADRFVGGLAADERQRHHGFITLCDNLDKKK